MTAGPAALERGDGAVDRVLLALLRCPACGGPLAGNGGSAGTPDPDRPGGDPRAAVGAGAPGPAAGAPGTHGRPAGTPDTGGRRPGPPAGVEGTALAAGGGGALACRACRRRFPVVHGVPRFVPEGPHYAASFGIQWTRYEVWRPEEDRAVFGAKTGFAPEELRGRLVLDAGCGSGRYAAVAAALGARVVAVDATRAVDRARELCASFDTVHVLQADLLGLPFAPETFDLVYSVGVLHHTPDPRAAFDALVRVLRPGGRLAVWVYRRTTALQEAVNGALRAVTRRLPDGALHGLALAGAALGGVPFLRRLNLLVPFSTHPDRRVRVCDTYDWYACRYQSHHTEAEVVGWFRAHGFQEIRRLHGYAPRGRFYDWCQDAGLIPGSGVNVVGRRPAGSPGGARAAR